MKRKAVKLSEADTAEAAAPDARDIERARELVQSASPTLAQMLEAKPTDAATKGD